MKLIEKLINLEREATNFGFQWETPQQILAQIASECQEIEVYLNDGDQAKLQEEIGDLLHAAYSLCVFCNFDPETTLASSISKFEQRFNKVRQLAHAQGLSNLKGKSFQELMELWDQAKQL